MAVAALMLAVLPSAARAQDATGVTFRVLIDGVPMGSATVAANLPTEAVVLHQQSDPNIPSKQIISAEQGKVMLTTTDSALVSAMQAWIAADNAGFKNTVQRKTVEIDRINPAGPVARFALHGAWPSAVDVTGGATVITIVYQRLEPVP